MGAVIEDGQGRVLLVKHRPARGGYWVGKWICPGGRLEPGEAIGEGIRREVAEETGLEIELTQPLVPFERVVKSGGRVSLHVIYIDYLARYKAGELRPASDVGEAVWVEKRKLSEMRDELHEDTIRLLQIAGML